VLPGTNVCPRVSVSKQLNAQELSFYMRAYDTMQSLTWTEKLTVYGEFSIAHVTKK